LHNPRERKELGENVTGGGEQESPKKIKKDPNRTAFEETGSCPVKKCW